MRIQTAKIVVLALATVMAGSLAGCIVRSFQVGDPPVQNLPYPGNPLPVRSCTGVSVCSHVLFPGAGACNTSKIRYFDVALTNKLQGMGQPPLSPGIYQISYSDNGGSYHCANSPTGTNRWNFYWVAGHTYVFDVYFNCGTAPTPTGVYTQVALRLSP